MRCSSCIRLHWLSSVSLEDLNCVATATFDTWLYHRAKLLKLQIALELCLESYTRPWWLTNKQTGAVILSTKVTNILDLMNRNIFIFFSSFDYCQIKRNKKNNQRITYSIWIRLNEFSMIIFVEKQSMVWLPARIQQSLCSAVQCRNTKKYLLSYTIMIFYDNNNRYLIIYIIRKCLSVTVTP